MSLGTRCGHRTALGWLVLWACGYVRAGVDGTRVPTKVNELEVGDAHARTGSVESAAWASGACVRTDPTAGRK